MIDTSAFIHDLALVDKTSSVGARTFIWQFASVIRYASIGTDCRIATCSIIDGARIGDRCIISHGAFLDPGIVLEDDVFIGPQVSLCNDAWPRVSKDGFEMERLIDGSFVTTRICQGASLGANVVVLPGLTIGARAMIAAGSVVERAVPSDCLYKRDGSIVKIDTKRNPRRMREAR